MPRSPASDSPKYSDTTCKAGQASRGSRDWAIPKKGNVESSHGDGTTRPRQGQGQGWQRSQLGAALQADARHPSAVTTGQTSGPLMTKQRARASDAVAHANIVLPVPAERW